MPVYAFPPWTPARENVVRVLWDDGYPIKEINARTGFSMRRIYDRAARKGWKRRQGSRSDLQPRNAEIRAEYATGMSLRVVAKKRKMPLSTVHKIINPACYA